MDKLNDIITGYISKLDIDGIIAGETNDRWTKEGMAVQIAENLKRDCKDDLIKLSKGLPIKETMKTLNSIPCKIKANIWN